MNEHYSKVPKKVEEFDKRLKVDFLIFVTLCIELLAMPLAHLWKSKNSGPY